ncbi:hypothetical protein DM785_02505 [Deinococcus actinosclerus]|nr:hypothetical protein DM785_02505 [Deinococcus actinosclerus]
MKFDPVKHGAAVWKLQGLRWTEKDLGMARVFKDWDAGRLAATLGLDEVEVRAALAGGQSAPAAPEPDAAPDVEPAPAPAPTPDPEPGGVRVGSCWFPSRLLTLRPFGPGGFTLDPREAAPGRSWRTVSAEHLAQVQAVRDGVAVVAFMLSPEPVILARVPVRHFGGVLREVIV